MNTPCMHTHIHTQGECDVKMKAEVEVMPLQTKELHPFPANHKKLEVKHEMELSFVAFKQNQRTDP